MRRRQRLKIHVAARLPENVIHIYIMSISRDIIIELTRHMHLEHFGLGGTVTANARPT